MSKRTRKILYAFLALYLLTFALFLAYYLRPKPPSPSLTSTPTQPAPSITPRPSLTLAPSVTPTPTPSPTATTQPGNFYAAPDGSPDGDGSIERPWDLQTALNQPSALQPGNTVWLRGGRYSGGFISRLKGQEGSPITVRQVPGERAILDGDVKVLTIADSQWVNFWGFEVTNSANQRAIMDRPGLNDGVFIDQSQVSQHIQFINLVVHDLAGMGFAFWKDAEDSEIYGSLIYYNGVNQYDHGIYTQNKEGGKSIVDNIIFNNASHGIHAYSSENGFVDNFRIEGNTVFDNGVIGYNTAQAAYGVKGRNILVGGNSVTHDSSVISNYTYLYNGNGSAFNIGYNAGSLNITIANNYFVGGSVVFGGSNNNLSLDGNTLFALHTIGLSQLQFRDNTWLVLKPSDVQIFIRPNQYETGRANLTVFNWPEKDTVQVSAADLAGVEIHPGDKYILHNVQDYFDDLTEGVYDGNAISIPMTGRSVAQPVGLSFKPPSTFPRFGAFVLEVVP